jgi:lipoprotein signal peptidase
MQNISVFSQLIPQIPVFLVMLAGIILAIVYWRRHPRASAYTLIALMIFLITGLIGTAINIYLPQMLVQGVANIQRAVTILSGLNLAIALVRVVGWGLIFAAIFTGRQKTSPPLT